MTAHSALFIGSGQLLIGCARHWLTRGHRVAGVVSDCPEASSWAEREGLLRVDPAAPAAVLDEVSYDVLFSIVNHRVTPPELIARATVAAVNYHDSLLPAYAGFNAAAWAILDGSATHGITWHRMTAEVDAGGIFLQQVVDVDRDTALTLEAKCSAAALATFPEIVVRLERGGLVERPQEGVRGFHSMSERPAGEALLDLGAGAARLDRLVRALSYGPQDNPMALPKLWTGAEPVLAAEGRAGGATGAVDGTVLAVDDGALEVAAGGRELRLAGLRDARGTPLTAATLSALGVRAGAVLPAPDATLRDEVARFDESVRRSERHWRRRLAARVAPRLDAAAGGASHPVPVALASDAERALAALDGDARLARWLTALTLLVSRTGGGEAFDVDLDLGLVPARLVPFFAARVPVRVPVDADASVSAHLRVAADEIAFARRHASYARDVVGRYAALRTRADAGELGALPVALVVGNARPDGARLVLAVSHDGTRATLHLADDAAGVVAERLAVLMGAVLMEPETVAGAAPMLTAADRARVLVEWNDTRVPYRADACVHQLFEEQAARTPEKTAVVFADASLTYAELDARANAVAHALRAAGAGPRTLVGICVERSLDMMAGLLGILKAGAAYVPLDPAYPRERLAIMLEDSAAPVLLTQRHLAARVDAGHASVVYVEDASAAPSGDLAPAAVTPDDPAYVLFTSGSTGRPKGVVVLHRNVANFFAGMDAAVGTEPGVWLALTSISFDISVLELFWTLARGFEVVIQGESDRASVGLQNMQSVPAEGSRSRRPERMGFGLFYFAANAANAAVNAAATARGAYRLLIEGAKYADQHGFDAVWTPERHFHAFGGLYPNPSVTTAALATITSRIQLRAGSVVLPLHDPIRVAEEWSVVDNLSNGRVGLSFASGWHADDFAFKPENYARRRDVMRESIDTVRRLWRGDAVTVPNGEGKPIDVRILPRPVQAEPPMWIASAGSVDTFRAAGTMGANVLTNMLGQSLDDLRGKLAAYREARAAAGHAGPGVVTVMLHTFVGPDRDEVKRLVREPFTSYLATSLDLVKIAPFAFPAFKAPSGADTKALDVSSISQEDMRALLDHAFDRYFETAGLFGTPESAVAMVDSLKAIGVDELACLVDFGVDEDVVLAHLPYLKQLMEASNGGAVEAADARALDPEYTIARQLVRRRVTHMQCTPSLARMLASDPDALSALRRLDRLLLGGEALPADLAEQMMAAVRGRVLNMYGPTETTVWSTTAEVRANEPITIGRPIANTVVRILDARRELVPPGAIGELYIGGAGVTRGYLNRDDLTAERFITDPYAPSTLHAPRSTLAPSGDMGSVERGAWSVEEARLYRTGDLARWNADGTLHFLGRADQQVKVSGYRIELGEIEAVLARHPSVREAVVTAETHETAGARLVAYVVHDGGDAAAEARVEQWQKLWDDAYATGGAPDARFDTSGWKRSDTGEPYSAEAMREWLGHTVERLRELKPRRVLEIGCGTGMVLFGLLPHVEHYTAVDVAPQALERIRAQLTGAELDKVTLVQAAADAVAPAGEFDLVVVNSVAQYFPSAEYLRRVLANVTPAVRAGGHVWVGDVRSLAHLEAFHTWVELAQSPDDATAADLRARLERRAAQGGELVVDPAFFHALPGISSVRSRLKRGRDRNEMTCFRYDVVLGVGDPAPDVVQAPEARARDVDEIRALLASRPPVLRVTDLVNARASGELSAYQAIAAGQGTAASLRRQALDANAGVDPEALHELDAEYAADATFARSGAPDRFDVVLRHRTLGPADPLPDAPPAVAPRALTNTPVRARTDGAADARDLRAHLRAHLPEYMVPSAFVTLERFPLTPNGKIDRKALRPPAEQAAAAPARPRGPHHAPTNELETTIAEIWQALLGVDRVSVDDNMFDVGANSLLTVQASRMLSERLGRDVPLVVMFQYPTVRRLATHLGAGAGAGAPTAAPETGGRDRAERRLAALGRRGVRTTRGQE